MASSTKTRKGINSVLQKLEKTIEEGNYYHAQQMYKTLYFRLTSQKKYKQLETMLVNGAILMLKHGETNAGTELALLLLDHYKKIGTPVTKDSLTPLINIFTFYKNDNHPGKKSFIRAATYWSRCAENNNQGDCTLHNIFAQSFCKIQDYENAARHFVRGSNPEAFAIMLVEWAAKGYPSEADLYIARATLQYLCLSNLKDANEVFRFFKQKHPNLDTPLMNFIRFVLLTLERDALPLFAMLRDKYKQSLSRDPDFDKYLDHIAFVFFGIKNNKNEQGFGGMINNLLKAMWADDVEEQ